MIYTVVMEGVAEEDERQSLDDELEAAAPIVDRKARQEYAASYGAARYARKG